LFFELSKDNYSLIRTFNVTSDSSSRVLDVDIDYSGRIVYSLEHLETIVTTDLWIANLDGSEKEKLALFPGLIIDYLKYSEDNDEIIYTTQTSRWPSTWRINILSIAGLNYTAIYTTEDQIRYVFFDGSSKIIYMLEAYTESGLESGIYLLDLNRDGDNDGLTWFEEIFIYNTDPMKGDTDGDGLSDGVEVHVFLTDPNDWDSDDDGISDGIEVAFNASVLLLPEGWIKIDIYWKDYVIYIVTNSSVVGVSFNSTKKELSVNVGGEDGTVGLCNISIPKDFIKLEKDIKFFLDDESINFEIGKEGNFYTIHVRYKHSTHNLRVSYGGSEKGFGLNLIYIITAILMMVPIIIFIIKKKR